MAKKNVLNYYEFLGVSRGASSEEIQRAYRKRVEENNPETNGPLFTKQQRDQKLQEIREDSIRRWEKAYGSRWDKNGNPRPEFEEFAYGRSGSFTRWGLRENQYGEKVPLKEFIARVFIEKYPDEGKFYFGRLNLRQQLDNASYTLGNKSRRDSYNRQLEILEQGASPTLAEPPPVQTKKEIPNIEPEQKTERQSEKVDEIPQQPQITPPSAEKPPEPVETTYLRKDPKYVEILSEMKKLNAADINLEDQAEKLFRQKHPAEAKELDRKEKRHIYTTPENDLAYKALKTDISNPKLNSEERIRKYYSFVFKYPEKASAYSESDFNLRTATKIVERVEQKRIAEGRGPIHYKTLGVGLDDNEKEVKSAYREKVLEYHPDINEQDDEKIKQVNTAFEVLSDKKTSKIDRARYTSQVEEDLRKESESSEMNLEVPPIPQQYEGPPTEPLGPEFQIEQPTEERPVFQQLPEAPYQQPAQITGQVAQPRTVLPQQKGPGIAGQLAGTGAKKVAKEGVKKLALKAAEEATVKAATAAATAGTAVAGPLGTIGGFLGGLALSLGIGIAKKSKDAIGGFAAWLGGVGSVGFAAIGAIALPSFGVPLIIAVLVVPFSIVMILWFINAGAYIVPRFGGGFAPGAQRNIYVSVSKTPNPDTIQNTELTNGKVVTYTIVVTALNGSLTNVSFTYSCRVIKENANPPCPNTSPPDPSNLLPQNGIISVANPYTFTYTQTFTPGFEDSLVVDTFTVSTKASDGSTQVVPVNASVVIGNPPTDCPSGWPIIPNTGETLYITQGAYTTDSHSLSAGDPESIDIETNQTTGRSVVATHRGLVTLVRDDGNVDYGLHVEVSSNCKLPGGLSVNFISLYAHLSFTSVSQGQFVSLGQTLGLSGNSGKSLGPHLHYEFRIGVNPAGPYPDNPPYMWSSGLNIPNSYIPKNILRGCVGSATCNTTIP